MTVCHGTVHVNVVQLGCLLVLQLVAEFTQPLCFCGHLLAGDLACLAEADDTRDVECSRTHAAFVAAAVDLGRNLYPWIAPPYIQSAAAFRTVNLVPG